jgi:hypothetical protein
MDAESPEEILKELRGHGKPFGFVLLAVQVADSADDVQRLISYGIGRKRPPKPLSPLPHIGIWLRMYRSHRQFNNDIGQAFGFSQDLTATNVQADLRLLSKASKDEIEKETADLSEEELKEFLLPFVGVPFPPDDRTLRALLDDLDSDAQPDQANEPDVFDGLLASPTGQFFIRVWLPCWILYRTYPPLLLRQARLGNHDALDKLIRLDKSVMPDPVIAQHLHEIMHNGTRSDQKRFSKAMPNGPKVKLTKKSVRLGLAGLISQLALQAQCRVTAPEITRLFDAISRVRSQKIDTSLSPSPDTMKRAIQRNRDWPSIPPHTR